MAPFALSSAGERRTSREGSQVRLQFRTGYENLLLIVEKVRHDGGVEFVERAEDSAERQIVEVGEINPWGRPSRGDLPGGHTEIEEEIDPEDVSADGAKTLKGGPPQAFHLAMISRDTASESRAL